MIRSVTFPKHFTGVTSGFDIDATFSSIQDRSSSQFALYLCTFYSSASTFNWSIFLILYALIYPLILLGNFIVDVCSILSFFFTDAHVSLPNRMSQMVSKHLFQYITYGLMLIEFVDVVSMLFISDVTVKTRNCSKCLL